VTAASAARRYSTDEQGFRLIIDMIPGLVYTLSPAGELEFCNQQILVCFGRTLEELREWVPLVHPDDLDQLALFDRCIATGQPVDVVLRGLRHDGVYRWFHSRARPLRRDGQIVRWYGLMTDITELKQAEERLRRSEAFLLEAQRLSRCGSWGYDPSADKATISPEVLRIADVRPHEDRSSLDFWFSRIHPEDRQRVRDLFEEAQRERTAFRCDYRVLLPDGTIRHQHSSGHPVLSDKGELVEFFGMVIDVTEQLQAQSELERAFEALRTTEARLSRAMRIATVGELADSIARQVNQPLAAVVANGHACLHWLSSDPPVLTDAREAAERIVHDGKDAGEVVRRVRSLFQRATVERVPLDLNQVIGEVLRLIESDLERRQATVKADLDPGLCLVRGDHVQLQQLALNLLHHALEAMDSAAPRPRALLIRSRRQDDHAVVEVRAPGVEMREPAKAFEPVSVDKGSGMAVDLAICRSIVEAHDGEIWVEPGEGLDAAICFKLPVRSTP
jgi:PAS domain S-box-containing protein